MPRPLKLPRESFEEYIAMGVSRSYQAIAEHYGVSKVAVTNRARSEKWQERLVALEEQARERFTREAQDEMNVVRARQLKAARALQAKALEMLRDLKPERAIKAATALKIGWMHELLLLGEPTERQDSVEEVTRREVHQLLVLKDQEVWGVADAAAESQ